MTGVQTCALPICFPVTIGRLYRKGEELDTAGTGYAYKWSKRDKNGVLDANFGGTGNQYKTGKTVSVSASEIADKATYFCEVFE